MSLIVTVNNDCCCSIPFGWPLRRATKTRQSIINQSIIPLRKHSTPFLIGIALKWKPMLRVRTTIICVCVCMRRVNRPSNSNTVQKKFNLNEYTHTHTHAFQYNSNKNKNLNPQSQHMKTICMVGLAVCVESAVVVVKRNRAAA